MIKEALQYIVGLSDPKIQSIAGEFYSDKELHRVSYVPRAEPIQLYTLESLMDYVKFGQDVKAEMFIHVVSPTKVKMYSVLDQERKRECIAEVTANVPDFAFNRWINHETFCIALQSKFLPNKDRELLLKFAGTVESGTIAEYGDDGVTQKATVKVGIAKKGEAVIPNPVELIAYRTFIEVEQPASKYIFRMKDMGGVQCALYEADGGAWEIAAMKKIKEYLDKSIGDMEGYVVIS